MNQKEHCRKIELCVMDINIEIDDQRKSYERIRSKLQKSIRLINKKMKPLRKSERMGYSLLRDEYYQTIKTLRSRRFEEVSGLMRKHSARYGVEPGLIRKIIRP